MKDIKLSDDDCAFKYRVNGIIISDNKVLTVQIMDNGFYCLPGGHVKLKELSSDAIKREIKEEVNGDVKSAKLIAVLENLFLRGDKKLVQELSFYYLIDASNVNLNDYVTYEEDDLLKKLEFKWLDIDNLEKYNFKPQVIVDQIKNIKNGDTNLKYYSIREK